jgi:hypothetical protein
MFALSESLDYCVDAIEGNGVGLAVSTGAPLRVTSLRIGRTIRRFSRLSRPCPAAPR